MWLPHWYSGYAENRTFITANMFIVIIITVFIIISIVSRSSSSSSNSISSSFKQYGELFIRCSSTVYRNTISYFHFLMFNRLGCLHQFSLTIEEQSHHVKNLVR